jgi:Hypoxia induced protein conserved region
MGLMKTILIILVGLGMLGTLGVLLAGLVGLARGDENGARSNALMRWRVLLQGTTLALFALLVLLLRA